MKIIHSLLGIYIAYRDLGKVQMQKILIFTILHFILQSEIFCLWSNRLFRVGVRHGTAGHVTPPQSFSLFPCFTISCVFVVYNKECKKDRNSCAVNVNLYV